MKKQPENTRNIINAYEVALERYKVESALFTRIRNSIDPLAMTDEDIVKLHRAREHYREECRIYTLMKQRYSAQMRAALGRDVGMSETQVQQESVRAGFDETAKNTEWYKKLIADIQAGRVEGVKLDQPDVDPFEGLENET